MANNLVCGPPIRVESQSHIRFEHNLERDLTGELVAPHEGNLRLTPRAVEAIGHADPLPQVREDIDRHRRKSHPDIGAHEYYASPGRR